MEPDTVYSDETGRRIKALDVFLGDIGYVVTHKHAWHIYIGVTIIVNFFIVAACQCVGYYNWPQSEQTALASATPGEALKTNVAWYQTAELSPTSWMTDEGFLRYSTLLMWVTCVVTGLGMEVVIGEPLIHSLEDSPAIMQAWKASQLFFSLCISIALFSESPFGYPFLVIGFWKSGFPETVGYFRRAFCIGNISFDSASAYLNGIGTLVHHSTGAYLIICVSTHLMPLDRRILSMSLPLVAQHIVVLLKYVSPNMYALCEACLEVLFEWEVLSNLKHLSLDNGYDISSRGTAISMLVAHWVYWAAAFCTIPKMMGYGDPSVNMGSSSSLVISAEEVDAVPTPGLLEANRRSGDQDDRDMVSASACPSTHSPAQLPTLMPCPAGFYLARSRSISSGAR